MSSTLSIHANKKPDTNFGAAPKAKKPKFINDKSFDWMKNLNGASQRAVLGATAIVTQPVIDYYNPNADDKTRDYSVLKTVVKIVVGTGVGVLVRHSAIKLAEKMVKNPDWLTKRLKDKPETLGKFNKMLKDDDARKNFTGNFGTMLGIVGVVTADVLIDMPLAKFLIDKSAKKLNLNNPEESKGSQPQEVKK